MFKEKLRKIRTELKLSREEISEKTGITYRAYTSYETGDRKPSFEFLEQLAILYNVNLNWLIAGIGNPIVEKISEKEAFKKEIINEINLILKQKGL